MAFWDTKIKFSTFAFVWKQSWDLCKCNFEQPPKDNNFRIGIKLNFGSKEYKKFVDIGSYPFFRLGKIGVAIVTRSTSLKKLKNVNADLMKVIKIKKIKILRI